MLTRIVSGGQTGVDRGALDAALDHDFPHGGFCPRGRRAEDGTIPPRYQLTELSSKNYAVRTKRNVETSDGTLILHRGPLSGGTALTQRAATDRGKPCLCLDLLEHPAAGTAYAWIQREGIEVLNVAGPRESGAPGIGEEARHFVGEIIDLQEACSPEGG